MTDWELLRLSPVPVLLVKSGSAYRRPTVLAALDPGHAFAKSVKLDAAILRVARTISGALAGKLHAMHAFLGVPSPLLNAELIGAHVLARVRQQRRASIRATFRRVLLHSGIPAARQHLVERYPFEAIPSVAREIRAAIVVMGAVSRSGLKRVFIGNTAERVLDGLPCDVLVVKPPRFRSQVSRTGRGVRVISSPPHLPY